MDNVALNIQHPAHSGMEFAPEYPAPSHPVLLRLCEAEPSTYLTGSGIRQPKPVQEEEAVRS
jgi:hypothetical protein